MRNRTPVTIAKEKLALDRLSAFSDGVLAIVITILVLGIDIPTDHNFRRDGLIKFLKLIEPDLIAYVASFVMVGIYWIQHYAVFHFIRYVNRRLIWLNILFLLPITLLPFVAKLRALYRYDPIVLMLFASAHIFCGLLLLVLWRFAVSHPELLEIQIIPKVRLSMTIRILIAPVICLIAIVLAFVDINVATYIFVAVPFFYISHRVVDTSLQEAEQHSDQ